MCTLTKRDIYSVVTLLLLIVGEFFALWGGAHEHYCNWIYVSSIALALIAILLIWGYASKTLKFEAFTFTNLLASAIAPRPLGVVYLLGFVMHLSWLTDGVLNYIVGDPWQLPFLVGVIGILLLWLAFPDTKIAKSDNKDVVFISGISKINAESIMVKDGDEAKTANIIGTWNVVPLVRFLNLVFVSRAIKPENVKKILILSSNGNSLDRIREVSLKGNNSIADMLMIDVTEHFQLKDFLEQVSKTQIITVKDLTNNKERNVIPLIFDNNDNLIKTIIKITALLEFPEQCDFVDNLNIELTRPCDYDNFDECFGVLRKAVEKEDNKKQLLNFNLTPGTGIIGSLMTLFSIDNDRKLYFYAQFSKLKNSERLKPVDKDMIPLENLLSQALQKLKNPT